MIDAVEGFGGFSTRDTAEARAFWEGVIGLRVEEVMGDALSLRMPGSDAHILVYPKGEEHHPAAFTVLNLVVPDIGAALRALADAGVEPERYPGMGQDADGVMRGRGPDIAWFTDPSGNIVALIAAS